MTIHVKRANGTFTNIPNVKWHPEHGTPVGQIDAGLWVGISTIEKHIEKVNEFRKKNGIGSLITDVMTYINDIEFAEAEFYIYSDLDNSEPWKHYGLCIKRVPYAGDDDYWNVH